MLVQWSSWFTARCKLLADIMVQLPTVLDEFTELHWVLDYGHG